mgnify:CR=1 FL=1|tara:strand:- start:4357 stop:4689 length:333 start_codon:yes stop_codon:yes gene_type:complete
MSIIQEGVLKEINDLNSSLIESNDACVVVEKLAIDCAKLAQSMVEKANATGSVDERIAFLVQGLQAVINLIEDTAQGTIKDVGDYRIQIKTLEEVLEKIKILEDEEKKSD